MLQKNFEAFTNLKALKRHAIEKCGQAFITDLNRQGLNAKDDGFWLAVNDRLNIPADAYNARQQREREEMERQEQARRDREAAETLRLLDNKKPIKTSTKDDWCITVYELPDSEIFGKKFVAVMQKESSQIEEKTSFCNSSGQAYSTARSWTDNHDRKEQRELEFQRYYRALKPIYLIAIYLFSGDKFVGRQDYRAQPPEEPEARRQFYLEHFYGVGSYNGFDFDVLNRLEEEGLLEFSTTKKTLTINKAAVRQAIEAAKQINIPGMAEAIEGRGIPLDCLDSQNRYERMWAEVEPDYDEDED